MGFLQEALFELPFFERYSFFFTLLIIGTYSCFCFIQEIILRGAVQGSLMHFVTGPFAKLRVIATTTLIAMAAHMHLKEIILPIIIIVPNIFWCMLYYRDRSLLAVTMSHILIGVWVLFVLGVPGE